MATRIGIAGVGGRMGRLLVEEIVRAPGAALAGGTVKRESPLYGQDVGRLTGREPLGMPAIDAAATLFGHADVVIDFTHRDALAAHLEAAMASGKALVLGTSGLSAAQEAAVAEAARRVPIVYAANFAPAVNVMLGLVRQAAAALGPEYDIEIVEMHHRHKVDAPSGTALLLGEAAAAARGIDLGTSSERGRDGHTGGRERGAIGFASLRGGSVAGDHDVIFATEGERITLSHRAESRAIFARGAVRAALWLTGEAPGRYTMEDVLGLG